MAQDNEVRDVLVFLGVVVLVGAVIVLHSAYVPVGGVIQSTGAVNPAPNAYSSYSQSATGNAGVPAIGVANAMANAQVAQAAANAQTQQSLYANAAGTISNLASLFNVPTADSSSSDYAN